jgi:nitrogen fixation-related uncharacterized protein
MTSEQLMLLLGVGAFGIGVVALAMFLWDEPNDTDK